MTTHLMLPIVLVPPPAAGAAGAAVSVDGRGPSDLLGSSRLPLVADSRAAPSPITLSLMRTCNVHRTEVCIGARKTHFQDNSDIFTTPAESLTHLVMPRLGRRQ